VDKENNIKIDLNKVSTEWDLVEGSCEHYYKPMGSKRRVISDQLSD
jgi:hypothetical protein